MKKFRVLSFLLVCVVLFLFLTSIPSLHAPETPTHQSAEPKTLLLDSVPDQNPSHVIVIKTPILPETVPSEDETPSLNESESSASPTPLNETPPAPELAPPDEYTQGGYPKSELGSLATFSSEIPPSSNSAPASFLTRSDLFPEDFLNESPMVEKGKPGNSLRKISQNGGLDVIPRESGVNGRSIYGLREHKIEDGDTLEQMAARYLGDPSRADEIFELNQNFLSSKEELPIGLTIRIPDRE